MSKYILLVCLLSGLAAYGQKPLRDFYLKRSLKQDEQQLQFTVLDEDKRSVLIYNKHKFYHWYKAQKVMATQGGSSGLLLHGTFEAFHANKQLSQKGDFHRGLKHGKWMYWREDGTLCRIEQWSHGTQRGEQLFFNEKGEQTESVDLGRGGSERKVADSLIISNKSGTKQQITIYDERKDIIRTECKRHGVLHGKVVYYEEGKKVRTEKYRDGQLVEEEMEGEDAKDDKIGLLAKLRSHFSKNDKEKKDRSREPRHKKEKSTTEEKVKQEKPEKERKGEKKENK